MASTHTYLPIMQKKDGLDLGLDTFVSYRLQPVSFCTPISFMTITTYLLSGVEMEGITFDNDRRQHRRPSC